MYAAMYIKTYFIVYRRVYTVIWITRIKNFQMADKEIPIFTKLLLPGNIICRNELLITISLEREYFGTIMYA